MGQAADGQLEDDLWPAPGGPVLGTDPISPKECQGYRLNHTMYRISNPEVSIPFYRDVLGLRRIFTLDNGPCIVYYMAYYSCGEKSGKDIFAHQQERDGLLELIYIKGKTDDPIVPQFGHIGITVPDIQAAQRRFKELGVDIVKEIGQNNDKFGMTLDEKDWDKGPEPTPGFLKVFNNIVMIRDPDGYFIEVVPYKAG